ncbi:hypothetical protein D3C84_495170 [compost metagenome]
MTLTVDHQQAVVDAVEHRLQALLTGEQLIDIGCLMLAQRLGHDAEAPGELIELDSRRHRQHDVEISLPDVVRRFCQRLDRLAETPGDGVSGNEADD